MNNLLRLDLGTTSHYKDWKKNWQGVSAKFNGWGGPDEAKKVIQDSIERAKKS